jgi:hypothetical protein
MKGTWWKATLLFKSPGFGRRAPPQSVTQENTIILFN